MSRSSTTALLVKNKIYTWCNYALQLNKLEAVRAASSGDEADEGRDIQATDSKITDELLEERPEVNPLVAFTQETEQHQESEIGHPDREEPMAVDKETESQEKPADKQHDARENVCTAEQEPEVKQEAMDVTEDTGTCLTNPVETQEEAP
ncbi:unnamed protein product, partial [Gongylonema pulchrum]|uniref:Doublecortin domain-containing protein 2 n=1 Tax=Gongylonema pulchrum TaxID=637853 RepID=A0A183F0Y2_9BILA